MREILFKAKSLDNGEWREGYYFSCWNEHYILWGMTNNIPDMGEIDINTLCQFTGLLDMHGNKIFEGDILKREDGNTYKVIYNKIEACYRLVCIDYDEWYNELIIADFLQDQLLKIIGNIHDNQNR